MKNAHIKPGQLVPAELRLDIYKEAKRSIEAGDSKEKHDSTCMIYVLLESIFYGGWNDMMKDEHYNRMFPEFPLRINYKKNKHQALDELTKAIEKLEKETSIVVSENRNKTCLDVGTSFQTLTKQTVDSKGQQTIIDNIAIRINDNLNELPFDAALDVYNQIRENMRERREAEIAALEQPKNERLIYLKNIEL